MRSWSSPSTGLAAPSLTTSSEVLTLDRLGVKVISVREPWLGMGGPIRELLIAIFSARPLLGSFEQAFQYIQEFTGFFTPGICVTSITVRFIDTRPTIIAFCPRTIAHPPEASSRPDSSRRRPSA